MASKNNKLMFICEECGYQTNKWSGQCQNCGNWNTFSEKVVINSGKLDNEHNIIEIKDIDVKKLSNINVDIDNRILTGFVELDRVLGGGIVKGSVVLLSGSPGIGKSTLLLQICQAISQDITVFYFSGEESERQIKLRADRLSVINNNIYIVSINEVDSIINIIESNKPGLVVIDSIQTMKVFNISSSMGSIVQVREATNLFMNVAKKLEIPIIIVGHVNKDGGIAGPKVLEHIVDTVLYFEGENYGSYKILRTTKNRFGSTNEIGIFDMHSDGLVEISNTSSALLTDRTEDVIGTSVVCIMEGLRPIFVEVQALIAKSDFSVPRRTSTGFDYNRTCLIIAILEKKCGYSFHKLDVYVNIVGGIKLDDPSADLAIAASIISCVRDITIGSDIVIIGELGLVGEIRFVSNIVARIQESIKLGFKKCIIPWNSIKILERDNKINEFKSKIEIVPIKYIWELISKLDKK